MMTLLCLPLLAIAIQSPLWLARILLRWRVEHIAGSSQESDDEALRIRHLLGATAAVALAFSAAQMGVPADGESLVGLAIAALVAAGVSLFTTLPAVAATLCAHRLWLTLSAILLLDVAVFAIFLVITSVVAKEWPRAEEYVGFASMAVGFFVGLTGVMLVARRLGYRLVWGRRRTTLGDVDSASAE
ncbi:MAG: hypothetical protein HQ582_25430 [Planctomycetes bacterium]|nr:hypothetical protein [Planctomycetota bacterium]